MSIREEYIEAMVAFNGARAKALEAKNAARLAFQRKATEENGFGPGDVIEYNGRQGVFANWKYPYELCVDEEIYEGVCYFYPYEKDGSVSRQRQEICDKRRVKVIKRVEETQKEHQ